ncbi:MAG: hypothetical protein ACI4JS_07995 [Oscillospiraceae bacterium]
MKFKEYWQKKTIKQRVCFCVVVVLMLIFAIFIIKGNFIDNNVSDSSHNVGFQSSWTDWIDVGILVVLLIAYGIYKYHTTKHDRR